MVTGEDKESMEEDNDEGNGDVNVGFNEGREDKGSEFIDLGDVERLSD